MIPIEEIEKEIVAACKSAQATKGFTVRPKRFFSWGQKLCCALSAVVLVTTDVDAFCGGGFVTRKIGERYGWTNDQVWSFISGFDRVDFREAGVETFDKDLHALGERVRNQVLP